MASKKAPLRTVKPGEKPAAPDKPKSLSEAVESGTYLEILLAQRRQMVDDVKDERGPARAALHRQIALHSKEIASLQAEAEQEAIENDHRTEDEEFDASAV